MHDFNIATAHICDSFGNPVKVAAIALDASEVIAADDTRRPVKETRR